MIKLWPGETGKPSRIANPCSLLAKTLRSAGRSTRAQKGQEIVLGVDVISSHLVVSRPIGSRQRNQRFALDIEGLVVVHQQLGEFVDVDQAYRDRGGVRQAVPPEDPGNTCHFVLRRLSKSRRISWLR